jgi:hypothetical protein
LGPAFNPGGNAIKECRDVPNDKTTRLAGWRPRFVAVCVVISLVSLLLPHLIAQVPPVVDFPNHLARLWLIAGGIRLPPLDHYYVIDWSRTSTNMGSDLAASLIGPLVGGATFARGLLAVSLILPCVAGVALHRKLFGGLHWWQLTFAFAAWGRPGLMGLMNFQTSVGLAVLAAAVDPHLRRLGPIGAFAGRAIVAVTIFLWHPFGAPFYAGLLAALAMGPDAGPYLTWRSTRSRIAPIGAAFAAAAIPVIAILLIPGSATDGPPVIGWPPFAPMKKLAMLAGGMYGDLLWADVAAGVTMAAIIAASAWRRRLQAHFGLLMLGIGLILVALIMPSRIGTAWEVDRRLPIMALLTLLAAIRPDLGLSRVATRALACLLLALGLIRTAAVAAVWSSAQRDISALRTVLTSLPEGASLLTLLHDPAWAEAAHAPKGRYTRTVRNFDHYGALAVPWRHAFVPNLFAIRGQQPLTVSRPFIQISGSAGNPATIADLYAPRAPGVAYAARWRCFQYMLVLNGDLPDARAPALPLADLTPVADRGFAALYRIKAYAPQTCFGADPALAPAAAILAPHQRR